MRFYSLAIAACLLASSTTHAFTSTRNHPGHEIIRSFPTSSTSSQLAVASFRQQTAVGTNIDERIPLRQGSMVALITPMTNLGGVDIPSLRSLLRFHLESGTDGLCILGTTGESSLLTMKERKRILDVAVEEVKGKIPIMVGTGTVDPEHVKEQTLQAIDCGCDASLVVTPYYIKPPQRGLMRHFETMADMGLPVCIYNVPGRTGVDFLPTSIGLIAEHPNIVAVKEATGRVSRVQEIYAACEMNGGSKNSLLLFSGDDESTDEFVLQGGDGCISVTANVAPALMHNLMMAALKKDRGAIERINMPLRRLHVDEFCESNPIPIKWALKRMGKIESAYLRPPLDILSPEFHSVVESALKEAGLLLSP